MGVGMSAGGDSAEKPGPDSQVVADSSADSDENDGAEGDGLD